MKQNEEVNLDLSYSLANVMAYQTNKQKAARREQLRREAEEREKQNQSDEN